MPPISLWLCLVYLSKTAIVLLASLTFVQDKTAIISIIYPERYQLYMGLIIGIIPIWVFFICGFREKIWRKGKHGLFSLLKPLLMLAVILDVLFQTYLATKQQWAFSWVIGGSYVLDLIIMYWLMSSRHIAYMLLDWKFELDNTPH